MLLMTREIEKKARAQYPKGSDFKQQIVAKFFDPHGHWTWYLMNQDPNNPDYLWGIVNGNELEMGSFSLSEIKDFKGQFGLGIERDLYFKTMTAEALWEKLNRGEHV